MIQRRARDYQVSLWSLQDSFIAVLKQYGLEYKGQIENGKINDRDDGTQTFTFSIPMYYYKDGKQIQNPGWYSVSTGALLTNMRKIKVIFDKDSDKPTIYQFLIVKVKEIHDDDASLYCEVECEGLAFHELGKVGYKIALSSQDFYNDDYDWATNGYWVNSKGEHVTTQPLATLNYWNDKVFSTIGNWTYEIHMNWDSHSLERIQKEGVLEDYAIENDVVTEMKKRDSNRVYEQDYIDAWKTDGDKILPAHMTYAREKARVNIELQESNIYNITQSLAESFGVFCKYVYDHDATGHIIKRTVVYYNNFLNEQDGTIDITYPYQTNSISRSLDGTDLVTKLYVKAVEDTNSGSMSIIDVGANKSQEDYILNFDYVHEIGGITDEQYKAVDDYILQIRKLNEAIAPVSAKVISLQSQLNKLEAELTTRKNAVAADTEQLLNSTALLNSITNGDEVLRVDDNNPQTAVLLQDTSEPDKNRYYVKITQKGVYPESIHLYKKYSYQTGKLSDEFSTRVIQFDESGEVMRVTNIFINQGDSKTVYLTYNYRPKLYYERITDMWSIRLNEDTARRDTLEQEIARIKYSLYGQIGQYLQGVNVANLYDVAVYNKYLNLIQKKQDLIKDFNAMMGPALREGYWQPEDYTDYGDQYNERFAINLDNQDDVWGSTGKSYFRWDDQLFEGEQDIFYHYSAAELKQAYPCIDLSNKPDILQMIINNPENPISFVYKPVTAEEDNPRPLSKPRTSTEQNQLLIISGLYEFDENKNIVKTAAYTQMKNNLSDPQYAKYKEYLDSKIINQQQQSNKWQFNGQLRYKITPSMSGFEHYAYYYWERTNAEGKIDNITTYTIPQGDEDPYVMKVLNNYSDNIRILQSNVNEKKEGIVKLQLVSTGSMPMDGWKLKLIAGNTMGNNLIDADGKLQSNVATTIIKELSENNLTLENSGKITSAQNMSGAKFVIPIRVKNDNLSTNTYQWEIQNAQSKEWEQLIFYYEGQVITSTITTYGQVGISIDENNIHTLTLTNNNDSFASPVLKETNIRLIVKNLADYFHGKNGAIVSQTIGVRGVTPWVVSTDVKNTAQIGGDKPEGNKLWYYATTQALSAAYNSNLVTTWYYKNKQGNWQQINESIEGATISTQIDGNDASTKQSIVKLKITLNNSQVLDVLQDAQIKVIINNGYQEDYQYIFNDQEIHIVSSININNSWFDTPSSLMLSPDGQDSFATISVKAQNVNMCVWKIKPNGSTDIIELTVDDTNRDASYGSSRYSVNFTRDNTDSTITILTLSIKLPGADNRLRDNGTQIQCICQNGSGNDVYLPGETANNFYTLTVTYPIEITSVESGQWWAIGRDDGIQVGSIRFKIPSQLWANRYLTNPIILNINEIKIYDNDQQQNIDTSIEDSEILLNNNLQLNDKSGTGQIDILFGLKQTAINKLIESGIININNDNNDQQYSIAIKFQIQFNMQSSSSTINSIFSSQISLSINIRQTPPVYTNTTNMSTIQPPTAGGGYIVKQYKLNNKQLEPFTLTPSDLDFGINIDSVKTITWACGNVSTDPIPGYPTGLTYLHGWDDKIQPNLNCSLLNTESQNAIGLFNGVATKRKNAVWETDQIVGYSTHLYLKATNPWGTVMFKLIKFEQSTT